MAPPHSWRLTPPQWVHISRVLPGGSQGEQARPGTAEQAGDITRYNLSVTEASHRHVHSSKGLLTNIQAATILGGQTYQSLTSSFGVLLKKALPTP